MCKIYTFNKKTNIKAKKEILKKTKQNGYKF
jgi:hypothetical protein